LQIVTKPTRCTDNSATLIDHIITNQHSDNFSSFILTSKISDHFPLIYFLQCNKKTDIPKTFTSRNFSQDNLQKFGDTLSAINWTFVNDEPDAQLAFNSFSDLFHNLYSLHFPKKTVKFNKKFHNIQPWMSPGLLVSRTNKLNLASVCARIPSPVNINKYKQYRNIYNSTVRNAKKLHFEKRLQENQNNLKKTWEILRTAINSGGPKNDPISELFSTH